MIAYEPLGNACAGIDPVRSDTVHDMIRHPIFLSAVVVIRNQSDIIGTWLRSLSIQLAELVTDHEIIVVDNVSTDETVATLRAATAPDGIPNLQVFVLTKEVDFDTAVWAGVESALGDFVAAIDPLSDDPAFLATMIEKAVAGAEAVFAENTRKDGRGLLYRGMAVLFHAVYRWLNGVHLGHDAPRYRLLSRRIVNFAMRHPTPSLSFRQLPAVSGFPKCNLSYSAPLQGVRKQALMESLDRGLQLLVSGTRGPMRIVTALSMFGAAANLCYSVYVIAIFLFKHDVAPGWVTLSLQQSGMFFLISLVLLVLGEYLLRMTAQSGEDLRYHIGQEFTSSVQPRRSQLNVEDLALTAGTPAQPRGAVGKLTAC